MDQAKNVECTLSSFYEILSGQKSQSRDWETMRSLFFSEARLFPNSTTSNPSNAAGVDIDTYIGTLDKFLSQNDFYESGQILQFFIENNIACVISTYEARHKKEDSKPFKHGVNFVHFLLTGKEWKITSMIWQDL